MSLDPTIPPPGVDDGARPAPGTIRDRRIAPTGVLPRRIQCWIMIGTALLIVLIILVTGHQQPTTPKQASAKPDDATPASPSLVQRFAQELAARQQQQQAAQAAESKNAPAATSPTLRAAPSSSRALDVENQRAQQVAQSLFADNVVQSRRAPAEQPSAGARAATEPVGTGSARALGPQQSDSLAALNHQYAQMEQVAGQLAAVSARAAANLGPPSASRQPLAPMTAGTQPGQMDATPKTADEPIGAGTKPTKPEHRTQEHPADGPRLTLLEGTIIETVLVNRLNGTQAGPVTCLVTTPVYSADRQHVLIPAGARVLGSSSPVQSWGDSRLAVSFHRLLMPDGHTYSLDTFHALDQVGEAGVTEDVNRHYLQLFGASIAIGGLSGLTQFGTTSGLASTSFTDEYRQAAGSSMASSAGRILDRYLNVLPTITVREGYRIKVYLTNDFELPAYATAPESGGVQ